MNIQLHFLEILFYFGILNTIVLSFLIFFSKKNKKASRWLSFLLLAVSLNYFDLEGSNYLYSELSWYYFNRWPLEYLFGPCFLFYIRNLFEPKFKFSHRDQILFLPFIIVLFYQVIRAGYVALYVPPQEKSDFLYFQSEFLLLEGPSIVLTIYCFYQGILLIQRFEKGRLLDISSYRSTNLKWLKRLTFLILLCGFVWFSYFLVECYLFPGKLALTHYFPLWLLVTFMLVFMGYNNLLYPELLENVVIEKSKKLKGKYKTSVLDLRQMEEITEKIIEVLEVNKVYLDSYLTLTILSEQIGIPTHQVSQVINQHLKTSFYDLVNKYRVEEVKERLILKKFDHLTITAIAFDSGFNSKNSFNQAFKKFTGLSPSVYKKRMNSEKT